MADKATTTVICNGNHRGHVSGAVNGNSFRLPVNRQVEVDDDQLEVLRNSGVSFEIVSPATGAGADEGSSAPAAEEPGSGPQEPANDEGGEGIGNGNEGGESGSGESEQGHAAAGEHSQADEHSHADEGQQHGHDGGHNEGAHN